MSVPQTFEDEVLVENKRDESKMSRLDLIFDSLEEALTSDEYIEAQDEFVDAHSEAFPEEGDLPPECMKIYQQYVQLIEEKLLNQVQKKIPDFDFEELIPVIQKNKGYENLEHADVFEMLNAALDFNEFRSLMCSYNKGRGVDIVITTTKL